MSKRLCRKCKINIVVKDGNYCRLHAGNNPKLEKSFERGLLDYVRRHYPESLKK